MLKFFIKNLNLSAREEAKLFSQPQHHVWALTQAIVLVAGC
jgi:hypothetical protein